MKKIETIWHHLLYVALKKKQFKHTQQELAKSFGYSLSTINHALNVPSQIGAVRKETKFFVLEDFKKLLYYWASVRGLKNQIIYQTQNDLTVFQREGLVPAEAIYAGYSAAGKLLKEPAADYDKVYFYLAENKLDEAKRRFPLIKGAPNLFVLEMPKTMPQYGKITTLPQTFVDIWNLKDWYSHDFTKALEEKMYELLS